LKEREKKKTLQAHQCEFLMAGTPMNWMVTGNRANTIEKQKSNANGFSVKSDCVIKVDNVCFNRPILGINFLYMCLKLIIHGIW